MFEPLLGLLPGVTRGASSSWAVFRGRSAGSKDGSRSDGTMFEPPSRGAAYLALRDACVLQLGFAEGPSQGTLRLQGQEVAMPSSFFKLASMEARIGVLPLIQAPPSERSSSGRGPRSKNSVTRVASTLSGTRM